MQKLTFQNNITVDMTDNVHHLLKLEGAQST